MPHVEFRKDNTGKYRAEVKLPIPPHPTSEAQRRIERIVQRFTEQRPSKEFAVAHEAGCYSFWVPINPKAPLTAQKLTNTLTSALRNLIDDLTVNFDELKALH